MTTKLFFVCLFPTFLSGSNKKPTYFEPTFFFSAHSRCKIYFYLEDDSIQVTESKVENSGIPQGMNDISTVITSREHIRGGCRILDRSLGL